MLQVTSPTKPIGNELKCFMDELKNSREDGEKEIWKIILSPSRLTGQHICGDFAIHPPKTTIHTEK